jgi:hypothetical protein
MKGKMAILALGMVFVLAMPWQGWAQVAQSVQDHLALADSYQRKAEAERQVIAEHTQMKEDYRKQLVTLPKWGDPRAKEMDKHCDGIIDRAKELVTEFEKFAEWHRMRAAELEGQ